MGRSVTRRQTLDLLQQLREAVPDLVLRTTFITGFPGETEAHFSELLDFAAEQRFERMGVFTYSVEANTPAARLPGHVAERVKSERRDRLMQQQQDVAFQWARSQEGRSLSVILDRVAPDASQPNVWLGRSPFDAPEIDGAVYVTGNQYSLRAGDIVRCEIVASQGYDLVGVAVAPPNRASRPMTRAEGCPAPSSLPVL
jgi:ribosomal protein S12 methylthiotransferase